MNRQVTEAFDALADRYEKETDGIRPYNAFYERPAMMRMIPDVLSGLHVLDAGCAAGWYSEQLLRKGACVTAVDASLRMVEAAKGEWAPERTCDYTIWKIHFHLKRNNSIGLFVR